MKDTLESRYFLGIPRHLWKCGNCADYERRKDEQMACRHDNPERGPCMYWKPKRLGDGDY